MKILPFLALFIAPCWCVAQTREIEIIEKKVPALPSDSLADDKKSPLLLVKLQERGETFDDPTSTSYRVFDPAKPEEGLREIFKGPGNEQDAWAVSRVFGDRLVMRGHLNHEKEPDEEDSLFWWNLRNGEIGEKIDIDFMADRREGEWLVGDSSTGIARYHARKGIFQKLDLEFSDLKWLGGNKYLGVANVPEGRRIVRMDIAKLEYEVLGILPPDYPTEDRYFEYEIRLAGEDGLYAIDHTMDNFALWYCPKDGKWQKVIDQIKVTKTFGGRAPWLPAAYVGEGNFAISKTTKSKVPIPKDWPEDEKMFGAAEGVTVLVDGRSGKILKEAKPFIYHHNPPLKIPADWWRGGAKPRIDPILAMYQKDTPSLFEENEEKRTLAFNNGQVAKLGKEEQASISGDGRYALIYDQCPRRIDGKTNLLFRIIDGKTGTIEKIPLTSEFYEVWTEPRWLKRKTR